MPSAKIADILEKAIFYGLIFILVIPLFSLRTPIAGFLLNQEFVFQIVVEILLGVWLFWFFLNPQRGSTHINRISIAVFGVLLFILTFGLSTFFAQNSQRAFFSTWDRFSGFWLLIHLFIFFVILITFLKEKKDWLLLLTVSVLTSVISSLYALSQILGLIKVPAEILSSRVFGTFGNPAFLAAYLLFNIFLALYLWTTRINADKKLIYADIYVYPAIVIIDIIALILTGTRGAFLGLYAGLLFCAIFISINQLKSASISVGFRKLARISLVVLVLLPLIVLALAKVFPQNFYLARLSNPFYIFEQGLKNRLIVWNIAWQAIKERPLLGWGMDNFIYGFDKYFDARILENIRTQEAWFDRAHNIFLDYLVAGGIIGFFGYAFFLVSLIYVSWRLLKKEPGMIIFLGLLLAYLVQGAFLFDVFQTYLMLFLVAGFLNYLLINADKKTPIYADEKSASIRNNQQQSASKTAVYHPYIQGISIVLLLLLLPFFGFSLWQFNLKPALAMGRTWQLATLSKPTQATYTALYRQVFAIKNPYTPDLWLELARREIPLGSLKPVLETFDGISKDFQLDTRYFYQAGRLGNALKGAGGAIPDTEIETNFKKALSLSPRRVDIYYELAEFERLRSNPQKMLDYLNQAIALDDKVPQSHFNLAIAYGSLGRFNDAAEEAGRALALGYMGWKQNYSEVTFLIDSYLKTGRHDEELVGFYLEAVRLNSSEPQLYGSLAVLLKELGRYDEAATFARKVADIDPARKAEVEAFLRSIGR